MDPASHGPDQAANNAAGVSRRPRAPTINIDTTAMSSAPPPMAPTDPAADPGYLHPTSPVSPTDNNTANSPSTPVDTSAAAAAWGSPHHQRTPSGQQGAEIYTSASFESRDSRPKSPHNVSSPVLSRGNDPGAFLAVPNAQRSRQNSVNSDDNRSFLSQGDTMVGSSLNAEKDKNGRSLASSSTECEQIMHDDGALTPDQGREEDFEVIDNPFAFSPGQLNKMFDPKSLAAFWKLGGIVGLEKGLRTDRKTGLSLDEMGLEGSVTFEQATRQASPLSEIAPGDSPPARPDTRLFEEESKTGYSSRTRVFKDNRLPEKKGKSLLRLMWITYNDKVLILLSIAAAVSLAIGIYQSVGTPHDLEHPPVDWVEGVAIIVAIVIVVVVGSLNDYQKERQFAKLNKKKQDRLVKVIRSGKTVEISVYDILVGDVMHLEPGDMIPVDGVLMEGFGVKCDESQVTGESDIIRKRAAQEVYAAIANGEDLKKVDPFIQSGARVMEGVGTFLVTSTGVNSSYGKTLMSLDEDPEITPLQSKLNVVAEWIAKAGGAAGLLLFIILFVMFLVRLKGNTDTPTQKGQQFLNIFIVVVTIIVVAVPEGLPLAVTLALAFATTRMLRDNNLVRHLKACEVMGNATTICSDKTGTLTQNRMQVVAGAVGDAHKFGQVAGQDDKTQPSPTSEQEMGPSNFAASLSAPVKDLLRNSIALNSTAFEGELNGEKGFVGSKTETAMLHFARDFLGMGPVSEDRANARILHLIPFDSGRKCMGVVVALDNGRARLYVKGASEIMLSKCTSILRNPTEDMASTPMTEEHRASIQQIEHCASNSLRTIGIIYRDLPQWPPRLAHRGGDRHNRDELSFEDICRHMIYIGMVGIKDPLRPGVPEAVETCKKAGVVVRMVTGDNRLTAEAIAKDCGILGPEDEVLEGPVFRNMTKAQQEEIIPRLRVLARSSPEDKRILVKRLKDIGETVAVTGDGTNDAPALKTADVGFSMGIAGTEVAKEASAIILMDDDFNSIVKALKWGRAVNDAVKRFLQFQLTVNVTAVVLTFVSAIASGSESSVLTAVQLLWVNLIMDTLAALALATDPPQDSVLDRKPERKGASIVSTTMWKMIIGQAVYQLAVTFVIFFGAVKVLPAADDREHATQGQINTLVFNTFVWMQIFNQWNNRRLDNKFNIFEGLFQNWFFVGVSVIMCGGQTIIIFLGGRAFNIAAEPQTGTMWAYAIVLGLLSIPIGMLIRLVPDPWLESLVPEFLKRKARPSVPDLTLSTADERFADYPEPLADVRDQLAFIKRFKGGRLNTLKFAAAHPREFYEFQRRSPSHSREHSRSNSLRQGQVGGGGGGGSAYGGVPPSTPVRGDSFGSVATSAGGGAPTPESRARSWSMRSRSNSALGAATAMAGIVAAGIGAGWSPVDKRVEQQQEFTHFPRPSPVQEQHGEYQQQQPTILAGDHLLTHEPQDIAAETGGTGGSQTPLPEQQQQQQQQQQEPNPYPDVPIISLPKPKSPASVEPTSFS